MRLLEEISSKKAENSNGAIAPFLQSRWKARGFPPNSQGTFAGGKPEDLGAHTGRAFWRPSPGNPMYEMQTYKQAIIRIQK